MSFNAKAFAARWYASLLFPEDVPEFAADALEAGFDGPALRRLAGLIRPTSVDIYPWIDAALKEIGQVEPLSTEAALIEVGRDVARRIVNGSLAPSDGCRILAGYAMRAGYPAELTGFFQIDDEPLWGEYSRTQEERDSAILAEAREFISHPGPLE
ncbi:MAG TPA: hypothetical protein VJA94_11315 [Candidatus Angelobacter sp.]